MKTIFSKSLVITAKGFVVSVAPPTAGDVPTNTETSGRLHSLLGDYKDVFYQGVKLQITMSL